MKLPAPALTLAALLGCGAVPWAHADDAGLLRCRALVDAGARLACYDALALGAAQRPPAAATGAAAVTPGAAAAAPSLHNEFGLQSTPVGELKFIDSHISGAADVLTVANWYVGSANRIEEIRLADGSVIGAGAAPLSLSLASLPGTADRMRRLADPLSSAAASDDAAMLGSAQLLVQAMAQFGAGDGIDSTWTPRERYEPQPLLLMP